MPTDDDEVEKLAEMMQIAQNNIKARKIYERLMKDIFSQELDTSTIIKLVVAIVASCIRLSAVNKEAYPVALALLNADISNLLNDESFWEKKQ